MNRTLPRIPAQGSTYTLAPDFLISDRVFDVMPISFGDRITVLERFPASGEVAVGLLDDTRAVLFVMGERWPLVCHTADYWNSPEVLRDFSELRILGCAVKRMGIGHA